MSLPIINPLHVTIANLKKSVFQHNSRGVTLFYILENLFHICLLQCVKYIFLLLFLFGVHEENGLPQIHSWERNKNLNTIFRELDFHPWHYAKIQQVKIS